MGLKKISNQSKTLLLLKLSIALFLQGQKRKGTLGLVWTLGI